MEDMFKKVFYTGVGLVSNTRKAFNDRIDDLVNKGKLTREEGKKVVDNLEEDMQERRDEFETGLQNMIGVALDKLNLPTGEGIKSLEKRIKSLEIKVGLMAKEIDALKTPAKAASNGKTTKSTTRKTTKASSN